jgi:glycosyltransferase involved in cell wall biosynthesis
VPEAPTACVVVPARDARATIARCIRSLAAQRLDAGWEAVLVDDGSSDGTVELAEAAASDGGLDLRVIRQERAGPAAARNRGAAESAATALAFLDSDCFPAPGWLHAGLEALRAAELVQGRVTPDPGFVRGPFDRTLHVTGPSPLFESANLFVRRELFERVRGFEAWLDPEVGKAVAEDVWFGWRARRAGARIAFAPDALAHHAVFREGALAHVLERRRLAHFPALAAKVPELRDEFFFGRWFLTARSAAFDAAVAAVAAARVSHSPIPLAGAAPYAALLLREAATWRRLAPQVAAARLAADAVGFASLVRGSVRRRALVL